MEQKRVVVVIDAIGNPRIEAEGFAGQGCTDATAPLERALAGGNAPVERTYKPEWSQLEGQDDQHDHMTWTG